MEKIKVKPMGQAYLVVRAVGASGEVLDTKHFAPGQYMDVDIPEGGRLEVYDRVTFEAMTDGNDA